MDLVYKSNVEKLEEKVVMAVRSGSVLILENVGENISSVFDNVLSGETTMSGGVRSIQLGSQLVEFDSHFRLYLVSNLNTPHYLPETLSKVTFLDFGITPEGMKEQMLSLICRKEKPKDEDDKVMIMKENTENKMRQKEMEERILMLLSDSGGNVVEDDALVNSLTESKETAKEIEERLRMSEITQEKIDRNRNNYTQLACLATNIYFIIKELFRWESMYQFSLKWFEDMFIQSITDTPKTDSKNIQVRISALREGIMKHTFKEICRSLFV